MRLKIFLLAFLLWPPLLLAQFTQTQGTIKDPTGLPYANGTITPTLVCSGSPRFSSSGFPYTPPAQAVGLDANGSFVMQLADVTQLLPPGCTWSFHTCSAAGTIQPGTPISGGPVCFDVTGLAITGTVQDISSQLSAAAPRLGTGGTGGGATIPNGTAGQFLVYTSPNTVAGSPNLTSNGTTIQSTTPFVITNGTTTASLGIFPTLNVLSLSISGGTTRQILPILINGLQATLSNQISPNSAFINFNGTTANPPVCNPVAPANGRCISFSFSAGSSSGVVVSGALVGDGIATDCFLGNGTFGPCPGTGGGSTPISALTAAVGPNTISNGDNSQVWNWSLTTAGNSGLNISEDGTASTASGSSLVKISQPTAGSQAVALTVQSGSSSVSIPAVQVQNSTGTNVATIGTSGSISISGAFQAINITGSPTLCGGNCSANSSSPLGGVRVRGSDNSSALVTAAPGYAIIGAGGMTAPIPNAASVNNLTQVASPYFCTGTCTLSTVLCATGSLDSVNACSLTPQSQVIGISEGSSNTVTWAVTSGAAQVRVDNAAVIGHTLCTSTANAGSATDSGGTGGCTFGQQIGVVMAVSGTAVIPNGTGQTTVTFSVSAPKVALSLASGGAGSVGPGTAGEFAIYPNSGNNVLGSPNLIDSNGTVNSAEPFTAPNLQLSNPSGTLSAVGGTLTPVAGRGAFGFLASGTPAISRFGGAFSQLLTPTVNGTAVTQTTGTQTNFDFNNSTPAAPANGRNISWQQVANAGTISGALVGDGSTNCLSGQGTYVPCGSGAGGSGTVGNGTGGQFAFYSTTGTSVVGNPHLVDNGALVLTTLPFATVAAAIPGSGISHIGLEPPSGGQIGFVQGNAGSSTFTPFFGFRVAGSAVATTAAAPFVNLDPANPPAPANGRNITWTVSANNVSGAIVGDGTLNCLSGQGTYVACAGGTGGGVSGSGAVGFFPIFTNTTVLGNGPISAVFSPPGTVNNINVVQANGLPIAPSVPSGVGFISGMEMEVTSAAANCGGTVSATPNGGTTPGCTGQHIDFSQNDATSAGVNAALFAQNSGSATGAPNGVLDMGVMGSVSTQVPTAEERAGYFEANDANFGNVVTTTRRGVMGVAINATTRVTALNEGVVAQTGAPSSVNTQDFSMHCLPPSAGNATSMPTHACLKIEAQGTGVELQTAAHVFGNLPACTAAYEGSIAAITDGSASSGTVVGGGTNHVQIYCDGTNWTVNNSGTGGGGGGGVTSINTVSGPFTFTGAGVACSGTSCAFGGGTGSGTVGAGVGRQFAIYNGTGTAVVGTPNLLDSPTGVAQLTAEVPILPTAGIVLSTNQIGNLPTTPQIVSGGNSTPPAALAAGISGFAFGAAPAPGGSNIPLVNQNAGGWFPVTTTSVNAAQLSTTNADFNSTTPAAPANGINVTWQKTTPAAGGTSTSLSAAVVGDGLATDCLVGTGVFVPCPGGGVTPPPRTVVGTCPQTGTATGGNCTVLFTPAFVNPPVCTVTAIDQTPGTPTHVITWQIGGPNSANNSAFSIVFATTPAGIGVIFNYICMGNPN